MVVHPERLDWVGNFNWLLQQDLQEFFCYRQHDDTTAPEFFEVLLQAADKEPNAAAIYCDCQYTGGRNDIEIAPSIEGEPLDRMLQYIERLPAAPLRGLIRRAAIRQAGLVRSDEFRAALQVFVWLAKLLRWGNFRRVAKPLYYRLDHPRSFTNECTGSAGGSKASRDGRRCSRDCLKPLCRSVARRRSGCFFSKPSLTKLSSIRAISIVQATSPAPQESFMAECLERLRYEGNTHLLGVEELPPILQELQRRPDEISCSSGPECGELFIESASGPEWRELFIQGPECGELFIKSATYSRC